MDSKKFNKIWDALYILTSCFDNDKASHSSCQSFIMFFQSLTFVIPDPLIRQSLLRFYALNSPDNLIDICQSKKLDQKNAHLAMMNWINELNNFIASQMNIKNSDFKLICQLYEPNKIDKKRWGNSVWYFIHYTALNQKQLTPHIGIRYKQMMHSLAFLLPCKICRDHLMQNLRELPIDSYLNSSNSLFEWTFHLHNKVNRATGANIIPLSKIEEYKRLYM